MLLVCNLLSPMLCLLVTLMCSPPLLLMFILMILLPCHRLVMLRLMLTYVMTYQLIPFSFPFVCFFFGFSSCNDKPFLCAFLLLILFVYSNLIFYVLFSTFTRSEFDKLLRSLTQYLLKKVLLMILKKRLLGGNLIKVSFSSFPAFELRFVFLGVWKAWLLGLL